MRTPTGQDCLYYYEDMNRGRSVRECRVVRERGTGRWTARECSVCKVPSILQANGSPYLRISLRSGVLGVGRRVQTKCSLHGPIVDPYLGCGHCFPMDDFPEL